MGASTNKDERKKRVLGRGLAALMTEPDKSTRAPAPTERTLPIEKIKPCKTQPRTQFNDQLLEDLSASIGQHGILQPIVVRKQGEHYEIVAGERRWRAAGRAGLQEVPVIVRDFDDSKTLQIALIENIQRANLDALEEAHAFERLIDDHKLTHEELAQSVGRSRAAVSNTLRLLSIPPAVATLIREGKLTAGHARALLAIRDPDAMTRLAAQAAEKCMSVREVETRARALAKPESGVKRKHRPNTDASQTPAEREVEETLQQTFGTRVKLRQSKGTGCIELYFNSLDELDGLLDRLAAA